MEKYEKKLHLRWSDMDPNFHVRHSVYYDLGAQLRTQFLIDHGLTPVVMLQNKFGPILFREEAIFKRELHFGDELTINVMATSLKRDFSRFSMRHEIKRGDDVCAILNVDGAWINTEKRKLTIPPEIAQKLSEEMPRSADFVWV